MKIVGKFLILISFLLNILILLKQYVSRKVRNETNGDFQTEEDIVQESGSGQKKNGPPETVALSDTSKNNKMDQINVNFAGIDELQMLGGVGADLAEKIISEREKNGAFEHAEDLLRVNGLGPKKLADIVDQITM